MPRGARGGLEAGDRVTFTGERISRTDGCQDKAGHSIEQSSSCMRADCANSIEHDPSAPASPANKVIFPDLLRQKGTHFPSLC